MFEDFFYNNNDQLLYWLNINWKFICNVSQYSEPYSIINNNGKIILTIISYYSASIYVDSSLNSIKNNINIFLCSNYITEIYMKVDTKLLQIYDGNSIYRNI